MRVTLAIIIINAIVFAAQVAYAAAYNVPIGEDPFTSAFSLTPVVALSGAWWQFITYMFLHADPLHITLNMFVLFMFGVVMERALGWKKYIFLYMVSGVGSAAFYMLLTLTVLPGQLTILMLGASGAIYGILAAFGFMFPKEVIYVYFIPLPAISAVFIFAAIELVAGITGIMPGIANFGHLGGIITGALILLVWKRTSKPKSEREMRQYQFYWE
jgi:membrane associated rhomboid family serine protease